MTGRLNRILRRWTARGAIAAILALPLASAAEAQWQFPFGAAPPGEIAQRLRAEGFALRGPLYRRNSVYLADVEVGRGRRERLVIDAWSGEILQRFVVRRGHWGPAFGGEFAESPPDDFGPPPASDFLPGGPAVAPEEPVRSKPRPKSAAVKRLPAQTAPVATAQPGQVDKQQDAGAAATAAKDGGGPEQTPAVAPSTATPPAQPEKSGDNGSNTATAKDNSGAPGPGAAVAPPTETPPAAPPATTETNPPASTASVAASNPAPEKPAGDSEPAKVKEASPLAEIPPSASVSTAKADKSAPAKPESERPKSGVPTQTQGQSASATPPARRVAPIPSPKGGDKSKVNDIPVLPLD